MLPKLLAAFVTSIASKLAVISPAIASGTSIAVPLALSKILVICFDWLARMASIPSSPRSTTQCSMMVCSSLTRTNTSGVLVRPLIPMTTDNQLFTGARQRLYLRAFPDAPPYDSC